STKPITLSAQQIRLLAVLALINFVNFAARQAVVPLIPLLRDHLHASDAQLGDLQTWLLVVLAIASIPFGFLADRFSRKTIIAVGIVCWSVASFAGGLFSTIPLFLFARAMVGLGQRPFPPPRHSWFSAPFPRDAVPLPKRYLRPECCSAEPRAWHWAGSSARAMAGRRLFLWLRFSESFPAWR